MEVEPPVATLPERSPAAEAATEEAAVLEAAAEEAVAEEAEPPQADRAAAAATAPQTVQERTTSDLFHHVFLRFSQYNCFQISGHFFRPGSLTVFSLGTP